MKTLSNEELLNLLIHASSDNNEFDNRDKVEYYKREVLKRMKKESK